MSSPVIGCIEPYDMPCNSYTHFVVVEANATSLLVCPSFGLCHLVKQLVFQAFLSITFESIEIVFNKTGCKYS